MLRSYNFYFILHISVIQLVKKAIILWDETKETGKITI